MLALYALCVLWTGLLRIAIGAATIRPGSLHRIEHLPHHRNRYRQHGTHAGIGDRARTLGRTSSPGGRMSALPSKAEMLTTGVDVRYVAEADIRKRHPDQRGDRGMGNGGGYFFAQCGLYCRQPICGKVRSRQRRAQTRPKGWKMLWQFTVGVSAKGKGGSNRGPRRRRARCRVKGQN